MPKTLDRDTTTIDKKTLRFRYFLRCGLTHGGGNPCTDSPLGRFWSGRDDVVFLLESPTGSADRSQYEPGVSIETVRRIPGKEQEEQTHFAVLLPILHLCSCPGRACQ